MAKRAYDMAAESSVLAKIPVSLALMRLRLYFALEWMCNTPFVSLDDRCACVCVLFCSVVTLESSTVVCVEALLPAAFSIIG